MRCREAGIFHPLDRPSRINFGSAEDTQFVYDGDALIAEYDDDTGALLRRYVHGPNASADDPLVWYEGAGVAATDRRHLYADARGSIVLVADKDGNRIGINTYDEYGIPPSDGNGNNTNTGRFQYTGQIWLQRLGMYYYKARIYSPTLGRFLQTDPIGYEDQFNLYAYVANDPINNVDPTGLERCEGSEADCATVSDGAQRVRDMAERTPEGSELRATAAGMGEPGKGSLVIADPEATGAVFDPNKGAIIFGSSVLNSNNPDLVGQTITHEVVHDLDNQAGGDIASGEERLQREEHAYDVQNEYREAMGWKANDSKGMARDSFERACRGENSSHPSCR